MRDLSHILSPRQLMPRAVVVAASKRRLSNVERIVNGGVAVGGSLVDVKIGLGDRTTDKYLLRKRGLGQRTERRGIRGFKRLLLMHFDKKERECVDELLDLSESASKADKPSSYTGTSPSPKRLT